jgi:integrase/recombinase XerD
MGVLMGRSIGDLAGESTSQATSLDPLNLAALEHARCGIEKFFRGALPNANTRRSYSVAVRRFLKWCASKNIALEYIVPVTINAYIQEITVDLSSSTVRLHLTAVRMLFDWLVTTQRVDRNSANAVRGPKYDSNSASIDWWEKMELLESIETSTIAGLRDRAFVAVLVYASTRVGSVAAMNVGDYYERGGRWWIRFHEGEAKRYVLAQQTMKESIDQYIAAANLPQQREGALFPVIRKRSLVVGQPLSPEDALWMVRRRAKDAGLPSAACVHAFGDRAKTRVAHTISHVEQRVS